MKIKMNSGFEYFINNNRNYTNFEKMYEAWRVTYMKDLGMMSFSHKMTDAQKERISKLTKEGMKRYREANPNYAEKISKGVKRAIAEGKMQWDHHVPHPKQSERTKGNYFFCKCSDADNAKNAKNNAVENARYKHREAAMGNYFFCKSKNPEVKERATAWWKDDEKAKAAAEKARKHSHHKYIIDGIGFDSSWEATYYLYITYNDRDEKGIYHGPLIEKDYQIQLEHGTYFVDFKIGNRLVEIKSPHFFNDIGELIIPYNNPDKVQDEHSAEKQCFMTENNVKIITDITEYKSFIETKYGKGFVDLFDYSAPFPFNEPIYKCRRKGCKTPYEAWFIPELRQKAIFNRLMWGPFGRNEKENWTNGIFTPKHNNIEPKDVVQAFTIARIAPKVSELRESKINLGDAKSVVNPFCGFGACIRKCKKNGIYVKAYDIQNICNEDVTIADITTITDETPYDLLFACPPYSDKETWTVEMPVIKSCDEWIDECFRAFPNCKEYRFIVDHTEKYVDNISNSISNKNHLCYKSKEIELSFLKNQIKGNTI